MNIARIAWGELKRLAKDWKAVIWLVIMPLAFAFVFGSAFRSGAQNGTWIPVIDLDRSDLSGMLIEQMRQEGYWIDVKGAEEQGTLKQKWPYGVVIPAGFGASVTGGESVRLTVVKGDGTADRLLEVQSNLAQAIMRLTTALAAVDVSHRAWNDETKAALKAQLARPQLLSVERKTDRNLKPPPSGFYMSLPGILVMFVLQMILIFGGVTLVRDRLNGQFARLLTAPVFPWEAYAGKVLGRVFLALLQSVLVLGCGALLFKMDFGDHPLFLVPVLLSFAVFAGCLSILGGCICRTEKQVVQMGIFVAMFFSALGGSWWPIEIVPDLFKTIALCTPTYWGLHGIQSVMYFNQSHQVLTKECPMLLLFAAICIGAAAPFARQLARGRR